MTPAAGGRRRLPRPGALTSLPLLLLAVVPGWSGGPHPSGGPIGAGGIRLFVEREGSGPPLILLPAGPGLDHAYFHPYLSSLAPYATVVYLDPRGCGRSESRPAGEYTLDAMAADLEGLRRAMGFERIDLLGHGLGQAVAALYADRYPGRVGRMIFLGGARRAGRFLDSPELVRRMTPEMEAALGTAQADRYLSADGRLRERFRILTPLLFHRLNDRGFHRAFVDQVTLSAGVCDAMAAGLADGAGPADLIAPLTRLKVPVLIVAGRHDPTASVAEAEALRDTIPGARLAVLEESGSFPFAEQPVDFLKTVREFLEGAPRPEAGPRAGSSGAGGGI